MTRVSMPLDEFVWLAVALLGAGMAIAFVIMKKWRSK